MIKKLKIKLTELEINFSEKEYGITIHGKNDFEIEIHYDNEEFTMYLEGWHDHFPELQGVISIIQKIKEEKIKIVYKS